MASCSFSPQSLQRWPRGYGDEQAGGLGHTLVRPAGRPEERWLAGRSGLARGPVILSRRSSGGLPLDSVSQVHGQV